MQEGDTLPWEGEVTDVTIKKITVYFEEEAVQSNHYHSDREVTPRIEVIDRAKSYAAKANVLTKELPYVEFKNQWLKRHGKSTNYKKKLRKCWSAKRTNFSNKFWKNVSGYEPDTTDAKSTNTDKESELNGMLVFRENTGKAMLVMENTDGEPYVPKGYKDIQYITDKGVREKWYQAVLEEHEKSEANGTFEWIFR
jgi:hypothetical protein